LLNQLRKDGHPTKTAEDLLETLRQSLVEERNHLALIEREVREEAQASQRPR
jgi:hypothetical protein